MNQRTTRTNTINLRGKTGQTYGYGVFPIGTTLAASPGNYAWLKYDSTAGTYRPIYIGQSGNLHDRVTTSHENFGCAQRNGATHVAAHLNNGGVRARLAEEADVIEFYRPVCNG